MLTIGLTIVFTCSETVVKGLALIFPTNEKNHNMMFINLKLVDLSLVLFDTILQLVKAI